MEANNNLSNLQVPGRMGLLITLYLITFNVYGSISSNMAPPLWEFSSQKGMKIRFRAKAGFELGTPEFPQ